MNSFFQFPGGSLSKNVRDQLVRVAAAVARVHSFGVRGLALVQVKVTLRSGHGVSNVRLRRVAAMLEDYRVRVASS